MTLDRAVNKEMHLCEKAEEQPKQVGTRQLYNQVAVAVGVSWGQDVEVRASGRQRALGPQWPTVEQSSKMRKKCCFGQKNLGQYVAVCPRLQLTSHTQRGCPHGVMVKAMDCGIVVSEFILQSCYYVHFWASTLEKGMNPLIRPAMG